MSIRLSYSQLNSLLMCGEQFRLQRIVKVPSRPGWANIGGSAVHEQTEIIDLRAHGVAMPLPSFAETFERLTSEAEESSGFDRSEFRASGRKSAAYPDKENAKFWLAEGPNMVKRWENWTNSSPWNLWITPDGKTAVELEFLMVLGDDGSLPEEIEVLGYIDRVYEVDGHLVVVDLKTGASAQQTPRQLGTYKVGLQQVYKNIPPVSFGTFFDARKGMTSEVYPLNEYDEYRLTWQYGAVGYMKQNGLYLPNPSTLCSSCGVADLCYERTQGASSKVRPPWISPLDWGDDVA